MALEVAGTHSPKLSHSHETCTHDVTFLSPPKFVRKSSVDSALSGRRKLPKSPPKNSPLFDFATSCPEYAVPHSAGSESSLDKMTDAPTVFTFNDTELERESRLIDKRVSVLRLESDIPDDPPGCLHKTSSLSEFQDHPDLQLTPRPAVDSISLATSLYASREELSVRGMSPATSFETIRRVQTFNDKQEKPMMELRRISTINLPPTDTSSVEFRINPDINLGSCLSLDGLGRSLDSEIWQETVSPEVVNGLTERETNRQSAIHELIWTEQNHLLTLKVMQKIFMKGMKEVLHISEMNLEILFPSIDKLLGLSEKYLVRLLNLRSEDHKLESVGGAIYDLFCGEFRDPTKRYFGDFIRKQTTALASYKNMVKSRQFVSFIQKCESMPECRRKTLPDCYLLIAQRLTKYSCLMGRILKYTDIEHSDHECLQDAVDEVKEIVQSINDELTEEQNKDFLNRVTANFDSAILKASGKIKKFEKKLNFSDRKLISYGKTIWFIKQGKHTVTLETILMLFNESLIMLLEKDSRYYIPQIGDLNLPFIYLHTVLVKPNAVDRKSIFLINTDKSTAEMYRLMFETCEEAVRWQTEIAKYTDKIPKTRGYPQVPFFEQPREKEKKISKKATHSFSVKSDQNKHKQKQISIDILHECDQKICLLLLEREKIISQLEEKNKLCLDSDLNSPQRDDLSHHIQSSLKFTSELLQSRLPQEEKGMSVSHSISMRKISSPDAKPPRPKKKGSSHDLVPSSRSSWFLFGSGSECTIATMDSPEVSCADLSPDANTTITPEEERNSSSYQLNNNISALTRIILEQDTLLRRNNIPMVTDCNSALSRQGSTRTKFNKATQNYLQKLGVSAEKKSKILERRHTLHDSVIPPDQPL